MSRGGTYQKINRNEQDLEGKQDKTFHGLFVPVTADNSSPSLTAAIERSLRLSVVCVCFQCESDDEKLPKMKTKIK